jgi:signal transduction histidine kinase
MGVPQSEQKHLFERFFRASNAVNIQGTGLGLSIVSEYVKQLGGEIYFESEENVGSTFIVKLPKKKL